MVAFGPSVVVSDDPDEATLSTARSVPLLEQEREPRA